ncbi:putative salicylate hydroxylase [Aspergillus brunneoviolaceus CBS 621.78]|uniref:Salicylate hydroxylase n=1 Tax=Aspergillus brunneoviolaceus CBS 621.78 TaxID=1450534 RepID=A0ACD1G0L8_9EURO|nr:salicylate hydroxylase [Aspergillus brunneoviolaceus CBS 621.78]RAH42786.1 salicylate hydroxylase [Aspergillus brunneoviolaceus CBS 621.78]
MGSIDPKTASQGGLNILIAGAGIGGLAAAIALRKQGHRVQLFERSRFANEIGAAIHLTPNANSALLGLGIDAAKFGAVEVDQLHIYNPAGKTLAIVDHKSRADRWRTKWSLVHRAHLHEGLKNVAQGSGPGIPAELHTASKVVDIDPEAATITLENGQVFHGDVVIGADGVHSLARTKLPGTKEIEPFSSGKNAFRFLLSRKVAQEDPETKSLADAPSICSMWDSHDKRVVIYPCANNEILNFVCIHPDTLSKVNTGADWDQEASKDALLEVYKDFKPEVVKILAKADPQTLRVWPLFDMQKPPTWVNGRLAVLGDAVHPFLPYRASGGAMAIEDGVSLGVMLSKDLDPAEVPERLKLYEEARYTRATTIQQMTRDSDGPQPVDEIRRMEDYIYGHDEYDHSTNLLRKHIWSQGAPKYWRQPVVFGPMPGPRQDWYGRDRVQKSLKATFETVSIRFKTSRTCLQNLLPNDSWSFVNQGTVAYASFSQTKLHRMDWLGGGGYRHIGLYIEGVQYKKKNGETIEGTYLPILFESLTDPIVSGREELGMPKLYTAIDAHDRSNSHHLTTSWQGAVWGHFHLEDLEDQEPEMNTNPNPSSVGILVHRYFPKVGHENKGVPEAEYPVIVPHAEEAKVVPSKITRLRTTKNARFEIDGLNWTQLPTLHHIISRLAEIPVDEVVGAKIVEGEGVPDVSVAKRLE